MDKMYLIESAEPRKEMFRKRYVNCVKRLNDSRIVYTVILYIMESTL